MKPETGNLSDVVAADYVRRNLLLKSLTQVSALALIALAMPGCVTVGYDFINQQATVSFDAKTIKEPTK